jgi:hypothetical protein
MVRVTRLAEFCGRVDVGRAVRGGRGHYCKFDRMKKRQRIGRTYTIAPQLDSTQVRQVSFSSQAAACRVCFGD